MNPSYSNGLGTPGYAYPATTTQDPREKTRSHLAIINRDELVLNAQQTERYLKHQPAASAIANMRPSYTSNTRSSQDTYQTTNYSNYTVVQDTFGRNNSIANNERDRETKRLGG